MTWLCQDSVILHQNHHVELTIKPYIVHHIQRMSKLSTQDVHEKLLLKLAQTRSDNYFVSCYKKLHLVPICLRLKNPFRHNPDNDVTQAIIDKASAKLSNIALHKVYAKQLIYRLLWKVPHYVSMKLSMNHLIKQKRLYFSIYCSTETPSCCCATKAKSFNSLSEIPLCILRFRIKKSFQIFWPTISLPCTWESKPINKLY